MGLTIGYIRSELVAGIIVLVHSALHDVWVRSVISDDSARPVITTLHEQSSDANSPNDADDKPTSWVSQELNHYSSGDFVSP